MEQEKTEMEMNKMCMDCGHMMMEHDQSGGAKANAPCNKENCKCNNFMPAQEKKMM